MPSLVEINQLVLEKTKMLNAYRWITDGRRTKDDQKSLLIQCSKI